MRLYAIPIARICALLAFILGIVVIASWLLNYTPPLKIMPIFSPVVFNSALCMAVTGLALFLHTLRIKWPVILLALFVSLVAALTLLDYLTHVDLHVEELFFSHGLAASRQGRMGIDTAIAFFTLGGALLVFTVFSTESKNWITACFASIVFALAFVPLIGYILRIPFVLGLTDINYMPLQTSIGLLVLSIGVFFATWTFNVEGKAARWVIFPIGTASILIAFSTWKTIDLIRLRAVHLDEPYTINYILLALMLLLGLLGVYCVKKAIDIAHNLYQAHVIIEASNRSKERLLRYISHEVRNPLSVILGFSQPLLESEQRPEMREAIEAIHSSASNLKHIVDDLLAASRYESGKLELEVEEFELKPWLDSITGLTSAQAKQKGITFTVDFDKKAPARIQGDSSKLSQIIQNLCNNATKHTPSGGSVTLTLRFEIVPGKGRLMYIDVSDTGEGIPLEAQKNLFEPFYQVREQDTARGFGLGLAICKTFIDMMGGSISVTSAEGKGTTFHCMVKW